MVVLLRQEVCFNGSQRPQIQKQPYTFFLKNILFHSKSISVVVVNFAQEGDQGLVGALVFMVACSLWLERNSRVFDWRSSTMADVVAGIMCRAEL
jgi:hypothetical protein